MRFAHASSTANVGCVAYPFVSRGFTHFLTAADADGRASAEMRVGRASVSRDRSFLGYVADRCAWLLLSLSIHDQASGRVDIRHRVYSPIVRRMRSSTS